MVFDGFLGEIPLQEFGFSIVQVSDNGLFHGNPDTVKLRLGMTESTSVSYDNAMEGESLTRDPGITGTEPLVPHTQATNSGGAPFSPDTLLDGLLFPGAPQHLDLVLDPVSLEEGHVSYRDKSRV